MITQATKNNSFLHDVQRARKAQDTFHIWWLGRHGFLLKWNERYLLMDPVLAADTGHPQGVQASVDEGAEMTAASPVALPVDLNFVDVTTIGGVDTSQLDRATLRGLWTVSPAMRLVVPATNRAYVAAHLGIHPALPIGVSHGEAVTLADIEITAIATQSDETTEHGADLGYIYHFGDGFAVFHSSHLQPTESLTKQLKAHKIDVALLPVSPTSADETVQNRQLVRLAQEIGATVVIPHTADQDVYIADKFDTFVSQAKDVNLQVHTLTPGQRWSNAR